MDVLAIKEAPSGNFYESLGTLKGVDVTSASLGFKIINTRGFNSTSPVRSLQLIDGVDNQSPGLNFSLGNFLGASDLDVQSVDVIAGASSAYYGPGAFNGVIDMKTKDPFLFPGLTVSLKAGERSLFEGAVRWADVLKNKEGKEKFGYKINLFYLTAYDWEATNYDPIDDLPEAGNYYSGIDAVNIYGDEVTSGGNNYETEPQGYNDWPALTRIYRTGYREEDLADYDTRNLKSSIGLYYKLKDDLILDYYFNYGNGTTIYQGDNRYSLKNIQFFQHKIQLEKKDKFFIRAYTTSEDAGDSYDAVLTGSIMSDTHLSESVFYRTYADNYRNFNEELFMVGMPSADSSEYADIKPNAADYIVDGMFDNESFSQDTEAWRDLIRQDQLQWSLDNPEAMNSYNAMIRRITENQGENGYFRPGTERFDSLFTDITSRLFTEGGSRFFDESRLYHVQGEYKFDTKFGDIVIGGNGRLYTPDSRGTIFEDTLTYTRERVMNDDGTFSTIRTDSSYQEITNWEYGVYVGYEQKFINDRLIFKATLRMDKNQNFDAVFSPATSLVFSINENQIIRAGVSSAVRNPTLADQYLYYDVGRATLLGNLNGIDSLTTIESFNDARDLGATFNWNSLQFFDVDPIKPEQARTFEVGYRGTFGNNVYIDASYYYTFYKNFIGFNFGLKFPYTFEPGIPPTNVEAFRVAANATSIVTTQGFSIGVNYYFFKNFALTTNYSFNKLVSGDDDPIIPAFNTPEHKYNVGINARDLNTDFGIFRLKNWGFGINYKWVDTFRFEGSPQFTGIVPSYYMIDAAVSSTFKKINTTFKIGASNLTDNKVFTVYGGPRVGRMGYFSVVYEFINR
jgi:outer membrane receptor protein involved in Fe transport